MIEINWVDNGSKNVVRQRAGGKMKHFFWNMAVGIFDGTSVADDVPLDGYAFISLSSGSPFLGYHPNCAEYLAKL